MPSCPHDWEFAGELNAPGWAVWCSECGALGYRPAKDTPVEDIELPKQAQPPPSWSPANLWRS